MERSLERENKTSSKDQCQTRLQQFLGSEVMLEDSVSVKISKLV